MSQTTQILAHLSAGKTLTPKQALDKWGCFRLAARIHEFRSEGYDIHTDTLTTSTGARVAKYWMAS